MYGNTYSILEITKTLTLYLLKTAHRKLLQFFQINFLDNNFDKEKFM